MPHKSRLPVPKNAKSTHLLSRMQSEGNLKSAPERTLPRLRSMGQLSPPPSRPLPPVPQVPPRSQLRQASQSKSIIDPAASNRCVSDTHSRTNPPRYSSSSGSPYSQDDEAETVPYSRANINLTQGGIIRETFERTPHRTLKQTPSREEISQMLHLRGRLQEMGTTFTNEGAMLTYGNPPQHSDLQQMFHLGQMYDEHWNRFFTSNHLIQEDSDLWPFLRVLKKMLHNEGIHFNDQHRRLDYGLSHPRLIRLSDQYDVFWQEWFSVTLKNIHPAFRSQHKPIYQGTPERSANIGWDFIYDSDNDESEAARAERRSCRLPAIAEDTKSGMDNSPGLTVQKERWAADTAIAHARPALRLFPSLPDHMSGKKPHSAHLEEKTAASSRGQTMGANAPRYDSSPLHNTAATAAAARMSLRERAEVCSMGTSNEQLWLGRGHTEELKSLGNNEQVHAYVQLAGETQGKGKKSKGLRNWVRTVLIRKKDCDRDSRS